MSKTPSLCGCCGRACPETDLWWRDCRPHVKAYGALWDRTYRAQHGTPCPFDAFVTRARAIDE